MTLETTNQQSWLIYGAYGFTGSMIAREAARRGMKPVLAGRSREKTESLARELGLEFTVFDLAGVEQASRDIAAFKLVLNCAGPFSETADILVPACIGLGIHYLDIAGEPEMFERHFARQQQAAASGSVVLPGVGFDVVPSDTLAANLTNAFASKFGGKPASLELAFVGEGGTSAGASKTVLQMMSGKCLVRRDGKITRVSLAKYQKSIRFSDREAWCISIPWGDVSTAYYSTGIPNITVYMGSEKKAGFFMRLMSPFMPLLGLPAVKRKLFSQIEKSVQPPEPEALEKGFMRLWGKVCDNSGNCVEGTADVLEGFAFTTRASLLCVEKVLADNLGGGVYTPTMAFGSGIALEIEGSKLHLS